MKRSTTSIKESTLSTNLCDEAHALVRELAMACRKVTVYGKDHPQSAKAVEKPFFVIDGIFRFKTVVTLNIERGRLYMMNIQLKESVFSDQIVQLLQVLDVKTIIFERRMTIGELTTFIESMTRREIANTPDFIFSDYLRKQGVEAIQVNTETAFELFENRRKYRGDAGGDFSVRHLAMDQFGTDLGLLTRVQGAHDTTLLKYGIDFDPAILEYLLAEKIATISPERIRDYLTDLTCEINDPAADPQKKEDATWRYMSMFKLVESHPQHDLIVDGFDQKLSSGLDVAGGVDDPHSQTGAIKIELVRQVDKLVDSMFAEGQRKYDISEFSDSFLRLLKTGQQIKAQELLGRLIDYMGSDNPGFRQLALNLLVTVVGQLSSLTDRVVMEAAVDGVVRRLESHRETYEYSELLWKIFESCHAEKQYDLMARLVQAMAGRRTVNDNVTVYDSMAVKKGFENIARPEIIDRLIAELTTAQHDQAGFIKETLVNIGSESVALALSRIISHPLRAVRQLTLKILAELGKSSLKVFSRMLLDDSMLERPSDRHELPDEKWYIVRNCIFVLGSLHDQQGIPALRARISDKDVRVRREIIAALEKIGGEEAVDCLTLMADDPLREVREAAIIAIGLTGKPEAAPILIDIARRQGGEAVRAVTALGKLGGEEARMFLTDLLCDPQKLADLAGGRVSRDDLKVAVIKALGQIGDKPSIEHIKKFRESQSTASKVLFKNSAVNRAISEVLSRY